MIRAIAAFIYASLKHAWSTRAIAWLMVWAAIPAMVLPMTLRADGTTAGALTMILTYTPIAIFAVVITGSIWLGGYTLAAERIHQQFAMLRTKPVAGFAIWFGKWFAVQLAVGAILAIALLLFFGTMTIRFQGKAIPTHPVWTAYRPDESSLWEQARKQQQHMIQHADGHEAQHLPTLQQIANRLRQQQYRVAAGNTTSWNILLDAQVSTAQPWELHFQWRLEPMRRAAVSGQWTLTLPDDPTPLETRSIESVLDGNHVLRIPALDLPSGTESVILSFTSDADNEPHIFFDNQAPVSLNQQTGVLPGNLIRAAILMAIVCAAAAAMALTVSAFLSFPTTIFATYGILLAFLIATIAGRDTPQIRHAQSQHHGHMENWLLTQTEYFLDFIYRGSSYLRTALPFRHLSENIQVTLHDHILTIVLLLVALPVLGATLAHLKLMREEVVQ